MCHKHYLCIAFTLAAVGSWLASSASAALIAINNASFETPVTGDGGSWGSGVVVDGATVNGWTYHNTTTGSPTQNFAWIRNPTESTPGWASAADSGSTGGVPTGGDGRNHLYVSLYGSLNCSGTWTVSQTLTDTFAAGVYTLSAGVGYPTGKGASDDYSISVLAGETVLASYAGHGGQLTQGVFTDKSVELTIPKDSSYVGSAITIALGVSSTLSSTGYADQLGIDNVRLDFVAAPMPEPSSVVLLAAGAIGLAAYAWRKRK